ncbi:GYDIA family GHMP kinase [Gaetbulibacter jejuensis]|uniref:GYDIA family GHMP kinase n=1 Tax=Gaetbulibacter jejuensis TaxID=584607 RepID=UPI003008D599
MQTFFSNGKLLLTAEYVVLDGALSLAIPTEFGQSMIVEPINEPKIIWKSFDETGAIWFEEVVLLNNLSSSNYDNPFSKRLIEIFNAVKQLNPNFFENSNGFEIATLLDFPRHWGLGTSSTLINNIANWANVDAYKLLALTFGGSGYDIACAQHISPLTYQLQPNKCRTINTVEFNPSFKEQLYFVYLNKKQNSRDGIAQYKSNTTDICASISEINAITLACISCKTLTEFNKLITTHESIISKLIKQEPVKHSLFSDFNGSIKSLGAWGGDFVLATSETNPSSYFKDKGFDVILPYSEMVI